MLPTCALRPRSACAALNLAIRKPPGAEPLCERNGFGRCLGVGCPIERPAESVRHKAPAFGMPVKAVGWPAWHSQATRGMCLRGNFEISQFAIAKRPKLPRDGVISPSPMKEAEGNEHFLSSSFSVRQEMLATMANMWRRPRWRHLRTQISSRACIAGHGFLRAFSNRPWMATLSNGLFDKAIRACDVRHSQCGPTFMHGCHRKLVPLPKLMLVEAVRGRRCQCPRPQRRRGLSARCCAS